ncbi:MAG: LPS assembly protein LptD [Xanthomonadales bacterium]|nr:LPS assembly protein LptD [Xanthomonadales bacterium]
MHFESTRHPALALLAMVILLHPNPGHAQTTAPILACPEPALAPRIGPVPDRSGAPIEIYAEAFDARKDDAGEAVGSVELFRADQYLATEVVRYRADDGSVSVPSPLVYRDSQIELAASSGQFDLVNERGDFNDLDYGLTGSSARGGAERVSLQGGNESTLFNLWFTTCPGEDPEWLLSAKELELRHDEGVGVARGAKLELGKVPILYLPWMTFPIDDRRKSGLLYPSFGTANDNGLEIGVPWYWNIAPNQDATFEPVWYSERGVALLSEYRFLTRRTRGVLEFDGLPSDRKTKEDRWRYLAQASMSINRAWRAGARLERVSDNEYFQDFGGNLAQTSRQFLRSDASIDGAGRYWIFSAVLDDFQVIDDAVGPESEPYSRLPRLAFLLDAPLGRSGLGTRMDAEAVYFDRDFGVTGARLDVFPSLVWNRQERWGFFEASAGYRYTGYDLDNTEPGADRSPDRGVPILSLDSGVYLERFTESGKTQTLEPRLYYLYVPFEEQSQLPDFDTGEITFGFAQLFHYNRFTGADRQTDANQLTVALSTRTFEGATGKEQWNLNVGQIFYLNPPRVTLEEDDPLNENTSPFIAELNWHPLDRTNVRLGIQWSWEETELDVMVAGIDQGFRNGSRLAFEYRFRRDRLDQFDIAYLWPISTKWSAFSRVSYSLDDSNLLEGLIGVEYESCCWALRVAARRFLRDRNGGERDALYAELRLKGLGAIGRREPALFRRPAP